MSTRIKESPVRFCEFCNAQMVRQRFNGNGRLEDFTKFMKRRFCSRDCHNKQKQKDSVIKNQYHWRARKLRKSCCDQCLSTKNLQVHHIDKNVANNSPQNLMTLCASCHNALHWKERKANGIYIQN